MNTMVVKFPLGQSGHTIELIADEIDLSLDVIYSTQKHFRT